MKHTKILLAFSVVVIMLFVVGCSGISVTTRWSYTGLSQNNQIDSWTINATTIDGLAERNLDLSAAELATIEVDSNDNVGAVTLVLIQGDITEVFELSRGFNGILDTSNFEAGQILMRLNFVNARAVDLSVNWGR